MLHLSVAVDQQSTCDADSYVASPGSPSAAGPTWQDRVVPLLQERGAFRTEYRGTTLRSHLGLSAPVSTG